MSDIDTKHPAVISPLAANFPPVQVWLPTPKTLLVLPVAPGQSPDPFCLWPSWLVPGCPHNPPATLLCRLIALLNSRQHPGCFRCCFLCKRFKAVMILQLVMLIKGGVPSLSAAATDLLPICLEGEEKGRS